MQALLALVGAVAAFIAWWFQGNAAWLIGGLVLFTVVPFTLIVIFPTNKRLESEALDIHSEEAENLLRLWGKLHAVRTILSGMAFIVFLSVLLANH